MSDTHYDGTPVTNGTSNTHLSGQYGQFSMVGDRVCVVVDRFFIEDPKNKSKKWVEYNVRDLQTGVIYQHARKLERVSGIESSEEIVLHPATKSIKPGQKFYKGLKALDTDGDLVLVSCIGGVAARSVITGCINRNDFERGATKEDGQRRLLYHFGITEEFKKDGSYHLQRGEASIDLNKDEEITLTRGPLTVTLAKDNKATLKHSSGGSVELSSTGTVIDGPTLNGVLLGANATEKAILGDRMKSTVIDPIQQATTTLGVSLAAATVTLAPDLSTGIPTVATIATVAATLAALQVYLVTVNAALATFDLALSQKVKLT